MTDTWRNADNRSNKALDGIFALAAQIQLEQLDPFTRARILDIMLVSWDQTNEDQEVILNERYLPPIHKP